MFRKIFKILWAVLNPLTPSITLNLFYPNRMKNSVLYRMQDASA
ncbi:hypothetical protein HPSA20_0941 [Helicobacter pylori SouthAfrica20]|uniref:Uncharacterized protein n=1 Tax=Helicobacter pylori SouthAfrica20 TaxID=1352356 RepID=T1U9V3_HELPX|nr:hypothetical protein HPSA20_0941 [Helicobacter pylori SouthAfrica20]